jgi:hypothetical protein
MFTDYLFLKNVQYDQNIHIYSGKPKQQIRITAYTKIPFSGNLKGFVFGEIKNILEKNIFQPQYFPIQNYV